MMMIALMLVPTGRALIACPTPARGGGGVTTAAWLGFISVLSERRSSRVEIGHQSVHVTVGNVEARSGLRILLDFLQDHGHGLRVIVRFADHSDHSLRQG